MYYIRHNHTFKFGVDIVNNNDYTNVLNNDPNGYYTYNYIGNYFADIYSHNNGKATNSCNSPARSLPPRHFGGRHVSVLFLLWQSYGSPVFAISTMDYGFYGQDNWKLTRG